LLHNWVASVAAVQTKKINLIPVNSYLKADDLFSFSGAGVFSWWFDVLHKPVLAAEYDRQKA
jgi:hypothetical protein